MKTRTWLSIILSLFGFSIMTWFILRGIYVENFIDVNESINLDKSAKFGDFVGGFVGAIFAFVGVILLFETLSLQRKEFGESKVVFIKQQFDNTFFDLLNLHKENVSSFLSYDLLGNEKRGRAFFSYHKELLQNSFVPCNTISLNRKSAIESFRTVYLMFENDFSIYFRTLFQLYSLIERSEIEGLDKASYSKILRAQLSESELFFIRYNAMTEAGEQSSHYINVFNILKHLSHFELLEFKHWWTRLDDYEKNGLGTIFKDIKSKIKSFLRDGKTTSIDLRFKRSRYIISLRSTLNNEVKIEIKMDLGINPPGLFSINGLDKFNYSEIENLFKCILKELIIYSNFNKFNIRRELDFDFDISDPTKIIVLVKNIYGLKIKVHYWT